MAEAYENGKVDWDTEGRYAILRPSAGNGYINLHSDGRYVYRHYTQREAVMSLGRCE